MLRRLFVIALVCALGLVPLTAAAEEQAERGGTATTSANILDLRIEGLGLAGLEDGVSIGSLLSYASTDGNAERNQLGEGNPFALAELVLAGQDTVTARSDGETTHEGRQADLAGVGSVSAGSIRALVEDGQASSVIDALSGNIDAVLGNVSGRIAEDAVNSVANGDLARASNGVILSDLSLTLGDLLPADLLGQLPLSELLDLVGQLPLDANALTDVVGTLEQVQAELPAVSDTLDTELTGIVSELDSALAPVDQALNGDGTLTAGQLQDVISQVEGIQADLDNLGSTLELEGLLSSLEELDALDIDGLVDDLIGAIQASELLALDEVVVGAQTEATADDSNATASCTVSGARLLGQAAPNVDACDTLRDVLDTVDSTLTGVLGSLPVAGDVTDGLVQIGGLETSTNELVDGNYRVAQAAVQGLTLDIGSIELSALTDDLVSGLIGQIEGLLGLLNGDLGELLGGDLSQLLDVDLGGLLDNGLPGLLEGLTGLQTELDGVLNDSGGDPTSDVTDAVRDVLGDGIVGSVSPLQAGDAGGLLGLSGLLTGLLDQLEALGVGLPGGLATPAVGLEAAGVDSESEFAAAQAGEPQPVTPGEPTPDGNLPRTGGAIAALAALGLITAGGAGLVIRRMLQH